MPTADRESARLPTRHDWSPDGPASQLRCVADFDRARFASAYASSRERHLLRALAEVDAVDATSKLGKPQPHV